MNTPEISGHEETDPWVMNFVVEDTRDFSAAALMYATALATATFLSDPMDDVTRAAVEHWASGRFRKVVRRAKKSAFSKATAVPGRTFTYGKVTLHLCVPTPVDEVHRDVSRAQVSGLQVVDGPAMYSETDDHGPGTMVVTSNTDLDMSPGKEAAAVAHAAQLLITDMAETELQQWIQDGRPLVACRGLDNGIVARVPAVTIRDAGLTEVIPGSVTARGQMSR